MKKRNSILNLLCWFLGIVLCACHEELDLPAQQGMLRITLDGVSTDVQTRSTPAELKPTDMSQFSVRVLNASDKAVYENAFSETAVELPVGSYAVEVFYGDNPVLDSDAPYFYGKTDGVKVESDKTASANVECRVANALVSVCFGRDAAEKVLFDQYYQSYAVRVSVGGVSGTISNAGPQSSIYFRAGSVVNLTFEGVLKDGGKNVSMSLNAEGTTFPSVFQAADHAIVTLALSDPQSVLSVGIDKVELVEASVQASIPLSWLPAPSAVAQHQYDAQGNLVGTDIVFGNGYPGMDWKAEVRNSDGELVRTESGTGSLTSAYSSNASWPYLPVGEYDVVYYAKTKSSDVMQQTATRKLQVTQPTIKVSLDAYTSYTKYQNGDVDGANACDAYTIYSPTATIKVATSLIESGNYKCSFSSTLAGDAVSGTRSGNRLNFVNKTGLTPSLTPYKFTCSVTFDGVTVSETQDLRITGLPVAFNPPTKTNWTNSGSTQWNSGNVRLGNMSTGSQYITCSKFAIPAGTKLSCPYKVRLTGGTVATTLTLSVGSDNYFSQKSPTAFLSSKSQDYEGTGSITLSGDAESVKVNNSYGAGNSCSYIYYVSYKYAK